MCRLCPRISTLVGNSRCLKGYNNQVGHNLRNRPFLVGCLQQKLDWPRLTYNGWLCSTEIRLAPV